MKKTMAACPSNMQWNESSVQTQGLLPQTHRASALSRKFLTRAVHVIDHVKIYALWFDPHAKVGCCACHSV